jgi:hypothetical protein
VTSRYPNTYRWPIDLRNALYVQFDDRKVVKKWVEAE